MFGKFLASLKKNRKKEVPHEELMRIFKGKYTNFKSLLESNSELLKIITDIEEKLQGQDIFGMAYIRSQTTRLIFHTARMIRSFEDLSNRSYPVLTALLEKINQHIRGEMEHKHINHITAYVLPLSQITKELVDFVGGKNANLGEVLNRAKLPIPGGFAITTNAFEAYIRANDLMDEIRKQKMLLNIADTENILRVSENIQQLFLNATLPPEIEAAISEAYTELAHKEGSAENVKIAMRSSAIGEDSELSFAGQYLTVLNVPREKIIREYKQILASLFTPRAISYRLHMGIPFEEVSMSVACLEMIQAKVSGVMYTRHPFHFTEDTIIINALWGLGPYVVDGVMTPDTYILSKTDPPVLLDSTISEKPVRLVAHPEGYLTEDTVDPKIQHQPCLTEAQAKILATYALELERHFQSPQDIEWAMDHQENLIILQSRPLLAENSEKKISTEPISGYPLLTEGGDIACPGVGCGIAHLVRSEADLKTFPEEGVLVAIHSSPQYVIVMQKAQAIVTDSGSITGHMASLAREFMVPTILNSRSATSLIKGGQEITVDAYSGRIYQGRVTELLNIKVSKGAFMKDTPVYNTLRRIADLILPLNLTDPKSSDFTPHRCQTIHDVMRLVHEFSYTELFQISDLMTGHKSLSVRLKAPLPIDLYLIDLDGGLKEPSENATSVTPEQIRSVPFKALLKGMLREDLRHLESRPVELRGFFSVMTQQMLSPPNMAAERFGDKSYAIISDKYLNFSSRVGYHYSVLDAYCGQTVTKNYINFQFKGGAADTARRNRRALLIEKVLAKTGFLTEVQGDRITARFAKHEADEIADKLDYLGRLLLFTRQMDMLMHSEESVIRLAECFLQGDYQLNALKKCN